jgi:hypothetical protein
LILYIKKGRNVEKAQKIQPAKSWIMDYAKDGSWFKAQAGFKFEATRGAP